ncbi:MAG: heme NO-binding domain-containing protein [Flavobacteriaceae bacterium]|nr:heme NO-binding domain-containing protein [Flavobacteriaceae bacterium]
MKGFIFTEFIRFVEESHGLAIVDEMIESSNLPSRGVYSAFNSYPFDELATMLTFICNKTDTHAEFLLEEFGKFVFPYLIAKHPYIVSDYKNPLDLISSIENHIHLEVKKLYEDAELPEFRLIKRQVRKLTMIYKSKRKLTYFAIGLMKQTLTHFEVNGKVWIDSKYKENTGVKLIIEINE